MSIDHGGCDKIVFGLSKKYTRRSNIYVNNVNRKKRVVIKSIISPKFNSRYKIDLIDFQSHPVGKYKFILVHQDDFTKLKSS